MKTQCTATAKSTGERCRRSPIAGATVCRVHGAGAPQVRQAARRRLDELALPAVEGLRVALESGDDRAVVAAAKIVLDRTGYGPTKGVRLEDAGQTARVNIYIPSNGRERPGTRIEAYDAGRRPGTSKT